MDKILAGYRRRDRRRRLLNILDAAEAQVRKAIGRRVRVRRTPEIPQLVPRASQRKPAAADLIPGPFLHVAGHVVSSERTEFLTTLPPLFLGSPYPALIPRTEADGNDVAGVRLPVIAVPLATYTGWSLRASAFAGDDLCDAFGQKLDFRQTKTERLAVGDTRLSIEERYPNHGVYVSAVAQAASNLQQQRLLLGEDVERIVQTAAERAAGK